MEQLIEEYGVGIILLFVGVVILDMLRLLLAYL